MTEATKEVNSNSFNDESSKKLTEEDEEADGEEENNVLNAIIHLMPNNAFS